MTTKRLINLAAGAVGALLLIGLPLAGIALAGKPVADYAEFPPLTVRVQHAGFSWPVFCLLAALTVLVVAPFVLRVACTTPPVVAPPLAARRRFPWWGWTGAAFGALAWVVAWTRLDVMVPLQRFTFSPLWLAYIAVINALTWRRTGHCMLTDRPRYLAKLFALSAVFWWYFEYLNRFVQNWNYEGVAGLSPLQYALFATLPFATVLPAVLGTAEWLASFPRLSAGLEAFVPLRVRRPRCLPVCALLGAAVSLAGVGVWPDLLFPCLWLAPLVVIGSLRALTGHTTVWEGVPRGDWRRVAILALAALVCGLFWEMWNAFSLARWVYAVPFVNRFHIFEMPLLGYTGYLPFGLECAAVASLLPGREEPPVHIHLIAPRYSRRPMDTAWKTRMSPPLGLLVVGALTPGEHNVSLADENIEPLRVDGARPDLVGITVKVDTFHRACDIAAGYRARGVPVVMGGIHATTCPDDCLRHADAVVIGEAEALWPSVVRDAEAGRLQRLYRNSGPVPIDLTPVPRWSLLKHEEYLFTNTITIGRGCPWRCDFCYNSAPNVDARYRMKPLRHIVRDIESLGIRHVMFIDDNFIGDPSRTRTLVAALKPMRLVWHAAVSADIGRHEALLDDMAEAGCRSLFIGFETVNERNLRACHKTQNRISRYNETIRMIHERGIMVNASVVFGFDGDDAGVFDATVDWLEENRVSTMTGHILTPYPGTQLHARLEQEGRIIDRDLLHYNTSHVVFRPARMSPEALREGYLRAYRRFYSWGSILKRWPETVAQYVAYLEFNLVYRKFGGITSRVGTLVGMRNVARVAKAFAYRRPPRAAAVGELPQVCAETASS